LANGPEFSLSLDFDDLVFNSVSHQLAHGMQLEFSHDVGAVRFSGLHADIEDHRNLFAALSFGKELHDLSLTACQSISGNAVLPYFGLPVAKTVQHHFGNFRSKKCAVHSERFHGIYQIAVCIRFQYITAHTGLHYFIDQFIGEMQAKYDDFSIWQAFSNLAGGFETI